MPLHGNHMVPGGNRHLLCFLCVLLACIKYLGEGAHVLKTSKGNKIHVPLSLEFSTSWMKEDK